MDNDFLEGIDEQFQRLMRLHGNGKQNGRAISQSQEDRVNSEIVDQLAKLSREQKEEVLRFIRSLRQQKVE